ncbi:Methyltransferase-like protein 2-A [Tetrabaena socialis]|uniref:Methyltransferase-like protein 2-A n=1 Tax=Tetrabaena socialis TaxID=47790 RepID=A0A2J8ACV6_9CHLO|nr:Methyltransferase-like protein 2-A [Tetrabaena socialis]|eukprot:PNH10348.1 Methyltransferase-like protein 2-A [Tetrabaena socialis]
MTSLKLLPDELSDVPPHLAEFPDLAAGPATLLEVGCGVGNTVFPLLETNPALRIHCCDFAPSAIELVRQHPAYGSSNGNGAAVQSGGDAVQGGGGAVHAFVADITSDLLAAPPSAGGCGVPAGGCDLATMVFVLSAIHPQRMAAAVHNVARCLRPGSGRLLFRDYAEGDLAQERLAGAGQPKRLGPNFYVRGDGTRCYYFGEAEVVSLFASAGLVCDSLRLHERTVVNHKRDIAMDRRWLQAIFTLREPLPPPLPLEVMLKQSVPTHGQQQQQLRTTGQVPMDADMNQGTEAEAEPNTDVDADMASEEADGLPLSAPISSRSPPPPAPSASPAPPAPPSAGDGVGPLGRSASSQPHSASRAQGSSGLRQQEQHAGLPLSQGGGSAQQQRQWRGSAAEEASGPDGMDLDSGPCSGDAGPSEQGPGGQQGREQEQQLKPKRGRGAHEPPGGLGPGPRPSGKVDGGGGLGQGGGGGGEGTSGGGGRSLESQLEAEFFATICRDSEEVVAEEVAAAGAALSRVRLLDLAEQVAAHRLAAEAGAEAVPYGRPTAVAPAQTSASRPLVVQAHVEAEVEVAAGVSFKCLLGSSGGHLAGLSPAALALARILLASPGMLAGRSTLQLGPAPPHPAARLSLVPRAPAHAPPHAPTAATASYGGVLPAMAAVRGSARRVVVMEATHAPLAAAAADLRRNSHRIVIERLRLAPLDWTTAAAPAGSGGAAGGGGSGGGSSSSGGAIGGGGAVAAGYSYVSGAVRQIRDLLALQPGGYDIVYAAEPLGALLLQQPSPAVRAADAVAGLSAGVGVGAGAGPGPGRLLLVVVGSGWAAAHGGVLVALAAEGGWEVVGSGELAASCGVDVAGAAQAVGCAVLALQLR